MAISTRVRPFAVLTRRADSARSSCSYTDSSDLTPSASLRKRAVEVILEHAALAVKTIVKGLIEIRSASKRLVISALISLLALLLIIHSLRSWV